MDSFNFELIGTITIGVLGIVLMCQGHYIFHGKHGYKHTEREKKKSQDTRKQIEDLLRDK
tara:strand:+ start:350 stop:529 length:180 start_codon:yes stop_codon:yes gene_type:complete